MREPFYERLGPVAGVAGLALFVAGSLGAGLPPEPSTQGLALATHYADERAAVLVGTALTFVALPLLLWFYVDLWALLRRAGGGRGVAATTMLVAFVMAHTISAVGTLPLTALVFRGAGDADPDLLQMAFDINNLALWALSAPVAGLAVAAASAVIWRTGCLPRYLVVLGAAKGIVAVFEVLGVLSRSGFNAAGYAAGLGALTWVMWVAAVALEGLRRPVPARPPLRVPAGRAAV